MTTLHTNLAIMLTYDFGSSSNIGLVCELVTHQAYGNTNTRYIGHQYTFNISLTIIRV